MKAPIATRFFMAALAAAWVCGLGACGADGTDDPHTVTRDRPPSHPIPPERPTTTCVAPERPQAPGDIQLTRVFGQAFPDGRELRKAVEVRPSPTDPGRWYALLQGGKILTFKDDAADVDVFLDHSDKIYTGHHETGLVSMAFHPDFGTNGWLYIVYARPTDAGFSSRVARLQATDTLADPSSETVVIEIPQPHGSHSGNHVVFGPDGMLYFSLGDGRNASPAARRNGQDPHTLYAAILRLDVDHEDTARGTAYAIPADNPFADGVDGAPEVFAYGFRNPWRFSFDRETGELWVGDVGQSTREEVDRVVAGGNYGWPLKEGFFCFEADAPCDDLPGIIDPVIDYPHTEGLSVTAGFVYRGDKVPALDGRFVYADYANGSIWTIEGDDNATYTKLQLEPGFSISTFSEDDTGELYVVRYSTGNDGGIYRLDPAPARGPSSFPQHLSETGCVDVAQPEAPLRGVHEYGVRAALWSDGAAKGRLLSIPDDQRIYVEDDGDMDLPVGSVLVKHFGFGERYHETRLLVRHEDGGWAGYSYEWAEDQSDAELLPSGKTKALANGVRWSYPSRSQCAVCHTDAAGFTLGLEARQLNYAPASAAPNQLDRLHAIGVFPDEIADPSEIPTALDGPLPDPFGQAPVEDRARAYLHVNCSGCHRPGGPVTSKMDLRWDRTLAETRVCDEAPDHGTLYTGNLDLRLVVPGDPTLSILYIRMTSLNVFRMPPLGSQIVDSEGTELIREWIEGLSECP